MDIQHIKTVKQLYARDMTKTTKLTMRLVTVYIQSMYAAMYLLLDVNK